MDVPETRYARSGDVRIAYQVSGDGPLDVVVLPGWFTQVEVFWEFPPMAELLHRVESFGRLIQFDKRGVGLSDPIPLQALPTLEEWMDDLRAVLDAVGSERAALIATQHAGLMAMLFASTYPERTSALVLDQAFARRFRADDYPIGMPESSIDQSFQWLLDAWGTGAYVDLVAPDKAGDPQLRTWAAKLERHSASPSAAAAMIRMLRGVDARQILSSIRVATLVIHRKEGRVPVDHGRFLAEHIPGARYLEVPGSTQVWPFADDRLEIMDEVEEFLTGVRPTHEPDRVLATILFTDIVDSTKQAAERGDRAWRELLGRHRELVRRQLERHRGREVATTGDGFLATFDGPARAVRCAAALVDTSRPLGIEIRTGLHTGEIELMGGGDVGGIAVHIGARVSALAGSGEVLVSSTVKDLIAGSGIEFEDRGEHALKGVPGEWRLFAVRS